jgi:hypothetical protein
MYDQSIEERENEIRHLERIQSKLSFREEKISYDIDNTIYRIEREIAILKITQLIKTHKYKFPK